MFNLKGKHALITGSTRGIGRAIANRLALCGADVIIHGRSDINRVQKIAEELAQYHTKCFAVTADTRNPLEIEKMFHNIQNKCGKLDILVNNAAVLSRFSFLELPVSEWDKIMETNARGYFLCTQYAAKMMKDTGAGRIINISSISQTNAAEGRIHYCASKAAIGMLTKGAALELAPYNITVNAILPGSIHTDLNADVLLDQAFYQKCVESIPAGRLGRPEDISAMVATLASDECSYVSGACIVIDGAKTV